MAGLNPDEPGFGTRFRSEIRAVMEMGMPADTADRPTFFFADPAVYTIDDEQDEPYDWDTSPANAPATPPSPIQVLCAVEELGAGTATGTSITEFDPDRMFLKFFEDEWAAIEAFTHVRIAGVDYPRGKQLRPLSLYDVTIHRVRVQAVDVT